MRSRRGVIADEFKNLPLLQRSHSQIDLRNHQHEYAVGNTEKKVFILTNLGNMRCQDMVGGALARCVTFFLFSVLSHTVCTPCMSQEQKAYVEEKRSNSHDEKEAAALAGFLLLLHHLLLLGADRKEEKGKEGVVDIHTLPQTPTCCVVLLFVRGTIE